MPQPREVSVEILYRELKKLDEEAHLAHVHYAVMNISEQSLLKVTESVTKRKIEIAQAIAKL